MRELEEKNKTDNSTGNKDKGDKMPLYIGGAVIGILAVLLIIVLARNRQKGKVKKEGGVDEN